MAGGHQITLTIPAAARTNASQVRWEQARRGLFTNAGARYAPAKSDWPPLASRQPASQNRVICAARAPARAAAAAPNGDPEKRMV
jgi:hypothetical protein